MKLILQDEEGDVIQEFWLGKGEGEWNIERPEESGMLMGEIEACYNMYHEEE